MRVVVTGAAGFIGGQTVLNLLDQGHIVMGMDRAALPHNLDAHKLGFQFEHCDIDSDQAKHTIRHFQPDCVIHCAGTSLVGPSIKNPAEYYHNNFVKTQRLVDLLCELRVRLVFSSSAAVYGEPVMTPCSEVDPVIPISPYGESKAMIEWMLASYARAYGLQYVSFRYFNACGADPQARHGQAPMATHIIARVLESLQQDREFQLYGDQYPTADGTCIRDYVHVADLTRAHVTAADASTPTGVYNLGTGRGVSNREIMAAAERITGRALRHNVQPVRAGDPAVLTADATRFTEATGWQAQHDLDAIIRHAWAWYTRS